MEQICENTPAEDRNIMRKRLLREYQKSLNKKPDHVPAERPINLTEQDAKLGLTEEQIAKQRERNRAILRAMDRTIRGVKQKTKTTGRKKTDHAIKLLGVLWSALIIGVLGFVFKLMLSNGKAHVSTQ